VCRYTFTILNCKVTISNESWYVGHSIAKKATLKAYLLSLFPLYLSSELLPLLFDFIYYFVLPIYEGHLYADYALLLEQNGSSSDPAWPEYWLLLETLAS